MGINELTVTANAELYIMSEQLREAIKSFLIKNKLTLDAFAKFIDTSTYILKKAISTKIKMSMYQSFYEKIASKINFPKGEVLCEKPKTKASFNAYCDYRLRQIIYY